MRVTFPHIGNMWIILKAMADKIGFAFSGAKWARVPD